MADKNIFWAILLTALLFIVINSLTEKPPPPLPITSADSTQLPAPQTPMNTDTETGTNTMANTLAQTNSQDGLFAQHAGNQAEQFYTIENDVLKITLTNKGGRIYKTELKNYVTYDSTALVLMDGAENVWNYTFALGSYPISTQAYFFEAMPVGKNGITYRMYADSAKTMYLEQVYTLNQGSYVLDCDFNMVGFDNQLFNNPKINLLWQQQMRPQEKDAETERYYTGVYFREKEESVNYLAETQDDETETLSLSWASFKQQFFNTTLIADKTFKTSELSIKAPEEKDSNVLELGTANLLFEYKRKPTFNFPMHFYMGPNHYQTLSNLEIGGNDDLELQALVPLGWAIFGWVNRWIIIPMFNFLNQFISNYGIIILVLTFVIKGVLFPLTYRSYQSFAKMNVLKPDLEEIKKKYEKDPQKASMAQMELYRSAGVNPMGGCLPQLLQMPILFAMYRFFPASIELRQQGFLWAEDLSTYDSIMDLPFAIPFYGDHVSLFCLLSAGATLLYMRLNQQMTPTGGNEAMAAQMKMFQYIMPFTLLFFFNSFSAGLTFYFFLSSIISFGQQYAIKNYFIDEDALRKQLQENKRKPVKKSKFQQMLEDAARAQQQKAKDLQEQREQKYRDRNGNDYTITKKKKSGGSNYTPPKKRKRK